jgi:small subunit ribosomal protein S16
VRELGTFAARPLNGVKERNDGRMSVRIRLARGGAKKSPFYRIVVADARSPRDGRFIEVLGTYNPMLQQEHADRVILKHERIKHWLDHGAVPSDRVAKFCAQAGLMEPRPRSEQSKKPQPKKKAQERMKAAAGAAATSGGPAAT